MRDSKQKARQADGTAGGKEIEKGEASRGEVKVDREGEWREGEK